MSVSSATTVLLILLPVYSTLNITDELFYKSGLSSRLSNSTCPPWFIYNETTSKCQCGNDLGGIVKCNDKEGAHEKLGMIAGSFFYNCAYKRNVTKTYLYNRDSPYHQLPLKSSELDEAMCGKTLKRTGRLCGKCMKRYQLSAYPYQMKCPCQW